MDIVDFIIIHISNSEIQTVKHYPSRKPVKIMTAEPLNFVIVGINYAPEITGCAPYNTDLAEKLASAGHKVTVITGLPHYPEW
jgi:hypothetical protein